MGIHTLAKLALIGLAYIYTAKLIDTLYHGVFKPAAFAGIVVGLNILAGFAQLAFFLALYNSMASDTGQKLKLAVMLAIVGSAIGLLPKFLALAVLFQHHSLFFFIRHGNQIGAFCPWLSAFLLVSFSTIFLMNPEIRKNIILKRAFIAGLAGWLIMFAAFSLVVVNYLQAGQLVGVAAFLNYGQIIFVITSSTAFLCLLVFYRAFIKADFSTGTTLQINE